jgi:hypothetical protein
MKIPQLGTVFLHANGRKDGQTDTRTKRTKVIFAFFYNFGNEPKYLELFSYSVHYDYADKCNVISYGKCQRHEDIFGSEGRNPRFFNFETTSDWHCTIMPLIVDTSTVCSYQ